jgi:hypothetical protein
LLTEARLRHGEANSDEHRVWISMRSRCNNPRDHAYHNYGGRGIKVCDRWSDYSLFLADMGRKPGPKFQIDRIDNDKGYEPANCRWALRKKNLNNKRTNHVVEFNGRRQTIAEWADETGINYRTLNNRINRGWTVERALTTPARKDAT